MKKFAALATLLATVSFFGAFGTAQNVVKVLPNQDRAVLLTLGAERARLAWRNQGGTALNGALITIASLNSQP